MAIAAVLRVVIEGFSSNARILCIQLPAAQGFCRSGRSKCRGTLGVPSGSRDRSPKEAVRQPRRPEGSPVVTAASMRHNQTAANLATVWLVRASLAAKMRWVSQAAILSDEPLLITAKEAIKRLGISRTRFYEMTARGEIPHVRLGGSIYCRPSQLNRWVEEIELLPLGSVSVKSTIASLQRPGEDGRCRDAAQRW